VVTGGASGIGRAIAARAVREGHHVLVVDRDPSALSTVGQLAGPGRVTAFELDVTDGGAVREWADAVVRDIGCPDSLVNNAGIARYGPLETLALDAWQQVLDVNLTGVFLMTQHLGRHMIELRRGSIVSIASVGSVSPSSGTGAYTPAKAGVAMLMQLAAVEWGPYGVRANCVSPGLINGGLAAALVADPVVAEGRRRSVPLRQLGTEEDIASAVLYLCSADAAYISGHNLVVDGGLTATAVSNVPRFGPGHPGSRQDLAAATCSGTDD
jgi:NAD(P)-dependent dehydrogenase (short-subunit alcohol dehydrogenase family)